ncbi:MAG: hypothetical protein CML61_10070 [Rhodobacteraceae bacterium]|nr:hypothetical protein [Paracoccaceae bacterium]|tara:strand:+ start:573 stop:833 length:261 start_codon:yes stop_codon:yes gene_type:complete
MSKIKAEAKESNTITGGKLATVGPGTGVSHPALLYSGEAPQKGASIKFILDNGVEYEGTVADATASDGNVLVEFKDGITPVKPVRS